MRSAASASLIALMLAMLCGCRDGDGQQPPAPLAGPRPAAPVTRVAVPPTDGPHTVKDADFVAKMSHGALSFLQDGKGRMLVAAADEVGGIRVKWRDKTLSPVTDQVGGDQPQQIRFDGPADADCRVSMSRDAVTNDLIVSHEVHAAQPGLESVEWSTGWIPLAYDIIIPAGGGQVMTKDSPYKKREFSYAMSWEAQLLIVQGADHGFSIRGDDVAGLPKSVTVERTERGWKITCRTINPAPFADKTAIAGRNWRINVHEGDWRVAARRYRDWAETALHPVKLNDQQPGWVKDIRVFACLPRLELPQLEELARHLDPKQTLVYLPQWRKQQFDRDAPDYDACAGPLIPYIQRAHELGFHVMLHTNYWGVTPDHPLMRQLAEVQVKSEAGQPLRYQNLKQKPPLFLNYISPASQLWRTEFIARMQHLVAISGTDAIHLDQNFHSHNDGNGPIDGLLFSQGVLAFHQELRAALPQIALGGEGLNEISYRFLAFAQRHVWSAMDGTIDRAALSVSHPISAYLFQPYVRHYGWLGFPSPHEKPQLYCAWRECYKEWGVFPTLRFDNDALPATLQAPHGFLKQVLDEAQLFCAQRLEPDLDGAWPAQVAFPYRAQDGRSVVWTKDRRLVSADGEVSRTIIDTRVAPGPGTIEGWLFYDQERLWGLKPDQFYAYLTKPRDPDATHVEHVPSWLIAESARLTADFLLVNLARGEALVADLITALPQATCGVRLDGGETSSEAGGLANNHGASLAGAQGVMTLTPPSRAQLNTDLESTTANRAEATGVVFAAFTIQLPPAPDLRFRSQVAMDGRAVRTAKCDGMVFTVRATAGGQSIEQSVATSKEGSTPLELDLSRFTGQTIILELIGDAGPAKDATEDRGVWYAPRIVQPLAKTAEDIVIRGCPDGWVSASSSWAEMALLRDGKRVTLAADAGVVIVGGSPVAATVPGQKLAALARTESYADLWNWPNGSGGPRASVRTDQDDVSVSLPVATKANCDWVIALPPAPVAFHAQIEVQAASGGIGPAAISVAVNDVVVKRYPLPEKDAFVIHEDLGAWAGQRIVLSVTCEGKARRGDVKLVMRAPRLDPIRLEKPQAAAAHHDP